MGPSPNPRSKKTVTEEEQKRYHQRFLAIVGGIRLLFQTAIIGVFAWLCVHSMFYLPIQAAHGETTSITVAQNWLANVNASVYLAWGASALGGAYGWRERKKRLEERKEKDDRISQLEHALDPTRSSSGLTPGGDISKNKPKDKP